MFPLMAVGKKRGHAYIHGVVTIISKENGKRLDPEVLSKKCSETVRNEMSYITTKIQRGKTE